MDWRTMLAHITGSVDEGLRLRNQYLLAENRVLRAHLQGKPKLTDPVWFATSRRSCGLPHRVGARTGASVRKNDALERRKRERHDARKRGAGKEGRPVECDACCERPGSEVWPGYATQEYRWCNPPRRGLPTSAALGVGRFSTSRWFGVSLARPR